MNLLPPVFASLLFLTTSALPARPPIDFPTDTVPVPADSLLILSPPAATGAVARLPAAAFNAGNRYHPYQLAVGKLPGVYFAQPGGDPLAAFQAQIRGLHTGLFEGNYASLGRSGLDRYMGLSQPLVVVDGLPGASLLAVDPQDITSIEVLRDMSSAAVYGARAANGVIHIRTRAARGGPLRIQYRGYLSLEGAADVPDFLDADAYRTLSDITDYQASTNWVDEITRTAFSQAHQLALHGGRGGFSHRLALHYRGVAGVARGSGFRQGSAWLRLRQALWEERLVLQGHFGYLQRAFDDVDPDVFRSALVYNPTAPVRRSGMDEFGGYFQELFFQFNNPVALLEQPVREGTRRQLTAQLSAAWRLLPGLFLEGRLAGQRLDSEAGFFAGPEAFPLGYQLNGSARRYESRFDNWWTEARLRYERSWRQHRLSLRSGYQYQRFDLDAQEQSAALFGTAIGSYEELDWGSDPDNGEGEYRTDRAREELVALFAGGEYQYRQTYFLAAHLRREGAARFGPDNPWGWFGGLAAGVALNRLLDPEAAGLWKLRLGWGQGGNLPPKDYAAHQLLVPGPPVYYNGKFVEGRAFYRPPNPGVGWERRREWNLGVDIRPGGGRWSLALDWYRSRSDDLLWAYLQAQSPYATGGFSAERFENFGELTNRGIEWQLGWRAVEKEGLSWDLHLIGAHNRTTLESLTPAPGQPFGFEALGILGGPGLCCARPTRLEEGRPIGDFYGPVYQNVGGDGQWIFADLDGDGQWFGGLEDQTVIGNAQPDFSLGLSSRLQAGRWSVDFFLRGLFGHDKLDVLDLYYGVPAQARIYNIAAAALEGERARLKEPPVYSSYFVENASFLRLEYLSIGYALPLGARRLELRLTGQNLFTLTDYGGVDPDLRLTNVDNPLAPGIDGPVYARNYRGFYFQPRGVMLGAALEW